MECVRVYLFIQYVDAAEETTQCTMPARVGEHREHAKHVRVRLRQLRQALHKKQSSQGTLPHTHRYSDASRVTHTHAQVKSRTYVHGRRARGDLRAPTS